MTMNKKKISLVLLSTTLAFILLISVSYIYLRAQADQYVNLTPENCENIASHKDRIVFLGDSHTQGMIGANFLNILEPKLKKNYQLINAGVNGEMAVHALKRLDPVISCKPKAVIILLGTNDINVSLKPSRTFYYRMKYGFTPKANKKSYLEIMGQTLDELKANDIKTAVISIPIIGEKKTSKANKLALEYNQQLLKLAKEKSVSYLELHERMILFMNQNKSWKQSSVCHFNERLLAKAAIKRFILKKSFNEISQDHGLTLLSDCIHLNETAAQILSKLILNYINESLNEKSVS